MHLLKELNIGSVHVLRTRFELVIPREHILPSRGLVLGENILRRLASVVTYSSVDTRPKHTEHKVKEYPKK